MIVSCVATVELGGVESSQVRDTGCCKFLPLFFITLQDQSYHIFRQQSTILTKLSLAHLSDASTALCDLCFEYQQGKAK
ncbi:hypothetical protein DAI22_12g119300 [Oryza sativa Japonica Group]|nr:hypothetical protein DAI22_12g119300 [Oryza sativa Japonica Group]